MKKLYTLLLACILGVFPYIASAQLDTSGIGSWTPMYNSSASWEGGAFGNNELGHPDYGWGIYNMLTHGLSGDSLFVIKDLDGKFKKLWIVEKDGQQIYTFRYGDLNHSNEQEVMLSTNDYGTKHFVHYSLSGDSVVDEQPLADSWDLLLTKFQHTGLDYVVTGFLGNDGVSFSVVNAADSATAAASTLADTTEFTDSIAAIGNSWYSLQGMSIVPLDTIAYFIKTGDGQFYKLQVTYFESGFSGLGRVGIRTQFFDETPDPAFVYDTLTMGAYYVNEVFYGFDGTKAEVPRGTWEIGFKTGPFTSSILANTTLGVELYTFPLSDIAAWTPSNFTSAEHVNNNMTVYPLPAENDLFIQTYFNMGSTVQIRIYDLTGKMVQETVSEARNIIHIDVSQIHTGMYILQLSTRDKQTETRRITVR